MASTDLSLELARRIALHAQMLGWGGGFPGGKEGVAQTIERLGYVQIDTIAVIARAHHHTLWTRRPDYDPAMLHELQAVDRRVFEYWGHAASYLPMCDYRYYLPLMHSYQDPRSKWMQRRVERCRHLLSPVKERIRQEGPLGSKDFEAPPGEERGTWWDWKPAKVALEVLYYQGELMITERRGFQKVYDLTERVLPSEVDVSVPDDGELGRFLVRRALQAHGVAQEREIHDHIHAADKDVISAALAAMVEGGEVVLVAIPEVEGSDYYVLTETVERAVQVEQLPLQVHLLSPFDNAIIQRERLERLFGYQYVLECYTPAAKRVYGYFTLPILWGGEFVGRLDPKADRKERKLIVRNLVFEPGFKPVEEYLEPFAERLAALARFNGCERVEFQRIGVKGIKRLLQRLVAGYLEDGEEK